MTEQNSLYDYDPDAAPDEEYTITVGHVDEPHDHYGGRGSHGRCFGETDPTSHGWLGNPYTLAERTREEAIHLFDAHFYETIRDDRDICNAVMALTGDVVACHCRRTTEDEPACHLDVIKAALLDGEVFTIADEVHDIPLPEWMEERKADPEVLL